MLNENDIWGLFFFWVSFGERWRLFIRLPPNHWSTDMKCHDYLCPTKIQAPFFIYLFWGHVPPAPPPPPRSYTPCRIAFFSSYSFETELIYHIYLGIDGLSKLILDENNDLHILWDVSCTFHVKIEPLHIWRRHVCILAVDVFLKICTFEGAVFAQMWLFAHFEGKKGHLEKRALFT